MNKYINEYKVQDSDTYENIRIKYNKLQKIYKIQKRNHENRKQLSVQIPNQEPSVDINQIQNFDD